MRKIPPTMTVAAILCVLVSCTPSQEKKPATSSADKWQVADEAEPLHGSRSVRLELEAQTESSQSSRQKSTPKLEIDCNYLRDEETEATLWTGLKQRDAEPSDPLDRFVRHTMWIQLDEQPPTFEEWTEMSAAAIEIPHPIRFSQVIAKGKLLTLKYTDYEDESLTLQFDVRGLTTYLGKVAEACGWRIGPLTGAPKLTEIRKVFVSAQYFLPKSEESVRMVEEWHEKVEPHTCLQPVAKLKDADAILRLDRLDTVLMSKDDETLWSRNMGYLEYKPLIRAIGCTSSKSAR